MLYVPPKLTLGHEYFIEHDHEQIHTEMTSVLQLKIRMHIW